MQAYAKKTWKEGRVVQQQQQGKLLLHVECFVLFEGHANVLNLVVVQPALEFQGMFGLVMDDCTVPKHKRESAVCL
jgi:hypothetical protein